MAAPCGRGHKGEPRLSFKEFWPRYSPHPSDMLEPMRDIFLLALHHVLCDVLPHSIRMPDGLNSAASVRIAARYLCPGICHPKLTDPFRGQIMQVRSPSLLEFEPPKDATCFQPPRPPQALDECPPMPFNYDSGRWERVRIC
jgi:hypothetical protein